MAPNPVAARGGVSKRKSTKNTNKKACYISDSTVDVIQCLEKSIMDILQSRDLGKTEAPRRLFAGSNQDWRTQMPNTRLAARQLARVGKIQILQKGNVLDPDIEIKGHIRLKLASNAICEDPERK
eukprot:jgi/Picsp_1/4067/NSC_01577-R2_---NA---